MTDNKERTRAAVKAASLARTKKRLERLAEELREAGYRVEAPEVGVVCACPRRGDHWLCEGRPDLRRDSRGRSCDLGRQIEETGSDHWNGPPIAVR